MERIKRNERMAALTKLLTASPNRIFTLSYFCEMFGAAKSTLSEDIDLLRGVFDTFGLGKLDTVTGAAGGVRYRPVMKSQDARAFLGELCQELCTPSRLLPGGFRHNEQSLRVAERLENDGQGLNLCRETLDGILNHSGQNEPKTLEGWCVRRADRIAYINHDIDDAIRGGILKPFELPRRCLSVLGETHGERIDTMIRDIVTTSMDQPFVRMSEEVRQASEELRAFLFEYVYHDEWRKKEEARCDYILSALYEHYLAHPEQLPAEYLEINFTEGAERAVCDFIACMTDRYAIDQFSEIFVPGAFGRR